MTRTTRSVVFDCNVFDQIAHDETARQRIRALVDAGALSVLVPPTLRDELARSPFAGVPPWFPWQAIPDSVFILDHSHLDETCLQRRSLALTVATVLEPGGKMRRADAEKRVSNCTAQFLFKAFSEAA